MSRRRTRRLKGGDHEQDVEHQMQGHVKNESRGNWGTSMGEDERHQENWHQDEKTGGNRKDQEKCG